MAMPSSAHRSRAWRALCQAAELADLDVDHVHGLLGVAAQQRVEAVDVFIEHEGAVPAGVRTARHSS